MIGQAKQMHQSCCLPGSSVMNNLSGMTDASDVWFPRITTVIEDAEVAEGQWGSVGKMRLFFSYSSNPFCVI